MISKIKFHEKICSGFFRTANSIHQPVLQRPVRIYFRNPAFRVGLHFVYIGTRVWGCVVITIAQHTLWIAALPDAVAERRLCGGVCVEGGKAGEWPAAPCSARSSLEATPCRVSAGEELCWGLLRGCTLDCPFGFLTDAHSCEICRCRPRPKKCRPTTCDKSCPFGYLYVFLTAGDLF